MKPVRTSIFLFFLFLAGSFAQVTFNPIPTRVIGQDSIQVKNLNPNLVEGRELFLPEGIALDTSTSPPALYVSDTSNNRVLAFHNAASFTNGQPADLVIGQPDPDTTLAAGPVASGTQPSGISATGLTLPSGIAVDSQGNVYVVDAGNNRILRFPKPFAQSGSPQPDIAIGQSSFTTKAANQGGISASTLSFTSAGATLEAFIAFDSSGNLWVADAGNNRVLRFNANSLGSQASSGPAADIVLGQSDFSSNAYNPPASNPLTSTTAFTTPTGIAFDSAGRLFVSESISTRPGRILMWTPPFSTARGATRLLGVYTSNPAPPPINRFQMANSPGGLFAIGNAIGIADPGNNRLLVFPPVEQWIPNTTWQAAAQVVGQPDFLSGTSNQGLPTATAGTLNLPGAAVFFNSELYVADSGNNRVVVLPQSQNGASFGPASMVLGQDAMNLNSPNLVEGREFDFTGLATRGVDAGLAVDFNANPPHLYVADTYNNRILGYNDLRNIAAGAKADLVIGQPDFQQTLANYPTNNLNTTNSSGLLEPTGLVVDSSGNLYVADTGNGRVLRFPAPFTNYKPGTPEPADLVLGQSGFTTTKVPDPTQRTMAAPYGLAFANAGGLLVSDAVLNRVLYFQGPPMYFSSGMPATLVLGQPDFNSSGSGSGAGQLSSPRHIAVDTDDRLYVADGGNRRLAIYNSAPTATAGAPAAYFLTRGLSSPRAVYVSPVTGEIWVGDPGSGAAIQYPPFDQLIESPGTPSGGIVDNAGPLALVEDPWGNLFMADAINRVLTYYPGLVPINAANFLTANFLAPGMIAALYSQGNYGQFGGQPSSASVLPLPTTFNGLQVLFNGSPVPLFYADSNQINFQVPMGAPQSGTADVQVVETATGRLLGDTTVAMSPAVPGIFTQTGNGVGTAVALNQDNTLNGPTNPALQGSTIKIYGTGQGFIASAPPDGQVPSTKLPTAQLPTVIIGFGPVPNANILYSGLSQTMVGVWELDVVIPDTVITTPTNPTQVIVIQDNVPSGGAGIGRNVQIYVKQKS
ncbi:MAG: hypothetical protein ABSG41_23350 [Bryobacteraceae bacterium]|jgi:uncharacterized protein (TIGR03437 family)